MNNAQQTNPTPPPQPPPSPNYVDSRPVRAALCGLIIGIGAVYNRVEPADLWDIKGLCLCDRCKPQFMGVLFLLDNLGAVSIRRAIEYWPLILIFLGVYLLLDYIRGLSAGNEHRSDRPSKRETDDPV
ncbi:MAG: DUF5668 domain-containing protein [Acidobacteriota bacterium]